MGTIDGILEEEGAVELGFKLWTFEEAGGREGGSFPRNSSEVPEVPKTDSGFGVAFANLSKGFEATELKSGCLGEDFAHEARTELTLRVPIKSCVVPDAQTALGGLAEGVHLGGLQGGWETQNGEAAVPGTSQELGEASDSGAWKGALSHEGILRGGIDDEADVIGPASGEFGDLLEGQGAGLDEDQVARGEARAEVLKGGGGVARKGPRRGRDRVRRDHRKGIGLGGWVDWERGRGRGVGGRMALGSWIGIHLEEALSKDPDRDQKMILMMSDLASLLATLKRELKRQGKTYREVAKALRISEPSVKRLFSSGRMTVERLVRVAGFLGFTLAELAEAAQAWVPRLKGLTVEQEAQLVSEPLLLLVAVCALNQWTLEQVVATYRMSEVDVLKYLLQLDRMGLLELLPGNRVRLRVDRDFDWIVDGPIRRFFRERCERDFLGDAFGGKEDAFVFVHGMLGETARGELRGELERLRAKFAQWHRESAGLPLGRRRGTALWMASREWEPEVFARLRRTD
jgi:hypothetical protein